MVNKIDLRRWLVIGTLVLLSSVASFAKPSSGKNKGCGARDKHCSSVPDGGSSAAYLLIAGSACLGAMVVRTRISKTRLS